MIEWVLLFFAPVVPYAAPQKDSVGMVAAEAAYAALLPDTPKVKPVPDAPDPNCPSCKGSGRVPSGDGQGWSKCPTCLAAQAAEPPLPPGVKTPKSDPNRYRSAR